ncbi:MAG: hypothetical protein V1837_07195 [Candidatus Woesearchaeota archaeon]
MKKADLSMNMIILAVLGIILLIVLVALFTGKIRIFSSNVLGSCAEQGGTCAQQGKCDEGKYIAWATGCSCYPPDDKDCKDKKLGQCCLQALK